MPDDAPIDLRLNSPGGSVFDAVAIYNALSRHAGTITVWIDGIAASAASYIAMAGDEIVMPENAFLMIHDPSWHCHGHGRGYASTWPRTLDKIAGQHDARLCREIGQADDEIAALLSAETWFDAKDALDAGLATRIAEPVRTRRQLRCGGSAMPRLSWLRRSRRTRMTTFQQGRRRR